MLLERRRWLKLTGISISSLVLPSWKQAPTDPPQHPLADNSPIKLSSNENPYGPSPKAREAMATHLQLSNRYSWQPTTELFAALAAHHNVTQDNVLIGAGSTELLDLVARYAARNKGELLLSTPTYDYWTVTPTLLGLQNKKIPLTAEKKVDLKAMLTAISGSTRLVYICNPNNPTGTKCDRSELIEFIQKTPRQTLILVDEAYLDFTTENSVADLINVHPNLIIVRTFSKIYGLAGGRIGFALAHSNLLKEIEAYQSMPNGSVCVVSAAAALASLRDKQFVADCLRRNEDVRAYTIRELQKRNMQCIASQTNFIYFSLKDYPHDYFAKLKSANIEGTKIYEEQGKWTRITVGTQSEMEQFIRIL